MDKRITPEEVLKAYQDTGIRPALFEILERTREGELCGCAIGVLMSQEYGTEYIETLPLKLADWGDRHGFDFAYLWGFMRGFDAYDQTREEIHVNELIQNGYQDGWDARELVAQFID